MTSTQPDPATGGAGFGWAPRRGTAICLGLSVVLAAYLFTPTWWVEIGADTKVFYAAGAVAASGGDPYQVDQINRMEDRLYNHGRRPFSHATYGYPPLVTALFRAGAGLSLLAFYLGGVAVLVSSGLAGFEYCLGLLGWQHRALPRVFFLASTPMALDVFVGNPSAVLLLASGAGAWLVARRRPLIGGVVLSITSLKPQVGLPIAAAVLLGAPFVAATGQEARRLLLLAIAGFATGALLLAGLGILLEGPGALVHWVATLAAFGGALGPGGRGSAFVQSGLAGLPSLLGGVFTGPVAVMVTAVVVLPLATIALRANRAVPEQPSVAPLALAISVSLALSPYLHLNDLVLGALPVLFVASQAPNVLTRVTLLAWTIGPLTRVIVVAVVGSGVGLGGVGQAGFGAVMTASLLLSVAWVSARRPQQTTRLAA